MNSTARNTPAKEKKKNWTSETKNPKEKQTTFYL
jgi:hypothetical protein